MKKIVSIMLSGGLCLLAGCWPQPHWSDHVQQALTQQEHKQFQAHDKSGKLVIFEWIKSDPAHPEFIQQVEKLAEIYGSAFAPMARQLVMTRPEVISTISHYKPLEHIISQCGFENIDEKLWSLIEEKMKQGFISSFKTEEITLPQDTIGWLIIVKDKETLQPLGLVQFSVSQNMPYGTIRVNNLACKPEAQRQGLGILMLSTLFKLVPDTNRLYLRVLETNDKARNAYTKYGFKEYIPLQTESRHAEFEPYMINLEYTTDTTETLQTVAKRAFFTEWMTGVLGAIDQKKQGKLEAMDKRGNPVDFEWHLFDALSPEFEDIMKRISNTVVNAFTSVELNYVQKHPESITDGQFKFLAPLFDKGIEHVDWKLVDDQIKEKIHHIVVADSPTIFDSINICLLVIAKDKKTQQQLGVAQFLINTDCSYGDVNVPFLGIIPEAQHRGLGKLLLSSIFTLVPLVKGIILSTRITNAQAINAYKSWGFTDYPAWTNLEKGWIGFEYQTDTSNILQKAADQLKMIKHK